MEVLSYPFNSDLILKKKKSIINMEIMNLDSISILLEHRLITLMLQENYQAFKEMFYL